MKQLLILALTVPLAACGLLGDSTYNINLKGLGSGDKPVDETACKAFDPIYLSEGAIRALASFRADKELIAEYNCQFELMCGSKKVKAAAAKRCGQMPALPK